MAPRKSTSSNTADANGDISMVSNATAASTTSHAHPKPSRQSSGGAKQDADSVGIDDLLLPRTLIQRLAKGVLPPNTSLQRDAVLALSKSATVFISYLAHHANEQSTRKTLSPQDVLKALKEVELAGVMDLGAVGKDGRTGGRLERELEVYEQALAQKRKGARDRKTNKARESTGTGIEGGDEAEEDERGEPSNKRARRMGEHDEDPDEEDRMLDLQLNGLQEEGEATHDSTTKATRRKGSVIYSSPISAEKGMSKAAETDSDPEGDDAEEEDDHENINDDEDDEDDEEDQDEDEEDNELPEEDQLEGRNGARSRNGGGGLQPNGRAEIAGSDDDSD
ncbi:hypothetical protein LTR84_006379 [Exophiala bonariae]|uniref:DNA polymerase epsilon subunit D n=1 Tax=Exophiala bonariae TaxID=1690606 RepID=A0AAV9N114_9EURO|nr:hypothetical protein LTR84_006379 [Exophiala bonariae]